MSIYRSVGGVNREINSITRAVDGTNRTISNIYRTIDGINRMVYPVEPLILYNYGDLCTEVTGGWSKSGYSYHSYSWKEATKGTEYMQISKAASSRGYYIIGTQNAIDLSKYKLLKVLYKNTGTHNAAISLTTTKNLSSEIRKGIRCSTSTAIIEKSIDISEISDSCYVSFNNTSEDGTYINCCVYKIWLE